ncbi:MAG TPA: hypothetical protein VGS11_02225 [Candidatus Bathyarchaeia archaeon]|nr:hypothetical protein [Candidatus Bathyarchaeia archaeon]
MSELRHGLDSSLSFKLKDGMVWVGAQVNDQQLNGILDSDSDETFLDTQTAQRLALKHNDQSGSVDPVSFGLGTSTLVASRAKILPIGNHFPGMDFILGFDALGKTPFTVDYSKSVIQLGTVPQGREVTFQSGRDVPSAKVTFSKLNVNAVIDTGAPAGLDLPFAWVKTKLPSVRFQQAVDRKDLGPRYEALPFMLGEVLIGGVKLSSIKAEAIRLKTYPLENRGDNWATIGNHILTRFAQIGIDGPNRKCVFVSQ